MTVKKVLLADDVDATRKLRLSVFFRMLQEISVAHTEELGQGRAKTLDKGVLWILARVKVEIVRMPRYDEAITFTTWPSATKHVLFPRNYVMTDGGGNVLIRAVAVWLLMDSATRKMAFPEKYNVKINGVEFGGELPFPTGVAPEIGDKFGVKKVEFSDTDINGHMNNGRYLDVAADVADKIYNGKKAISSLEIEYLTEARKGEILHLCVKENRDGFYLDGNIRHKPCFRFTAVLTDNI